MDGFNRLFDTGAAFHSIYIHTDDAANRILDTSGAVSGRGTVSAVYTMPMEETHSMYERISTMLVSEEIRDGRGFYGIARDMSSHENAKVAFSIIPLDSNLLFQLRLSTTYSGESPERISPLDYLQTEEIRRSDYLTSGFYPLNSLVQVVVLSDVDDAAVVSDVMGSVTPTLLIDGQQIPTDITVNGWVFDPSEGDTIQGKYLFGNKTSIGSDELVFSLGTGQDMTPDMDVPEPEIPRAARRRFRRIILCPDGRCCCCCRRWHRSVLSHRPAQEMTREGLRLQRLWSTFRPCLPLQTG